MGDNRRQLLFNRQRSNGIRVPSPLDATVGFQQQRPFMQHNPAQNQPPPPSAPIPNQNSLNQQQLQIQLQQQQQQQLLLLQQQQQRQRQNRLIQQNELTMVDSAVFGTCEDRYNQLVEDIFMANEVSRLSSVYWHGRNMRNQKVVKFRNWTPQATGYLSKLSQWKRVIYNIRPSTLSAGNNCCWSWG